MRVLFDTNFLVAILSRRESVILLKNQIATEQIVHVTSEHILKEVEAVLHESFGLTKAKAKAASRLLSHHSVLVTPMIVKKVCRDPFDDYVLAAATAGRVKYLVTADNDLLVLKTHRGIQIITPTEFDSLMR